MNAGQLMEMGALSFPLSVRIHLLVADANIFSIQNLIHFSPFPLFSPPL